MSAHVARVALNVPLERTFDYSAPPSLRGRVQVGSRVRVPFGPRALVGVVIERPPRAAVRRVREILSLIDEQPIYTNDQLRLGQWLAQRYGCSLGEALATMAPPATGKRGVRIAVSSEAASVATTWPEPSRVHNAVAAVQAWQQALAQRRRQSFVADSDQPAPSADRAGRRSRAGTAPSCRG